MLKNYFKQAWTLMRQNCLFTGIYVVGTGLSIALVMTLFIIFYVKFARAGPSTVAWPIMSWTRCCRDCLMWSRWRAV